MAPSDAPKRMLDPVEPGIAVFPGFARDDQTMLVFKEKVFNTSEVGATVCLQGSADDRKRLMSSTKTVQQ